MFSNLFSFCKRLNYKIICSHRFCCYMHHDIDLSATFIIIITILTYKSLITSFLTNVTSSYWARFQHVKETPWLTLLLMEYYYFWWDWVVKQVSDSNLPYIRKGNILCLFLHPYNQSWFSFFLIYIFLFFSYGQHTILS